MVPEFGLQKSYKPNNQIIHNLIMKTQGFSEFVQEFRLQSNLNKLTPSSFIE